MRYPARRQLVGEVANQLLGRLKNAFLAYGIEIRLAIPMVLHGLKIQARIAETDGSQFQFTSASGRTCVWVDANWNTSQEVQLADTEQHAKAEGDIMIFSFGLAEPANGKHPIA